MLESMIRSRNEHEAMMARDIRSVSTLQKETWRLVPNLALEADGRSGYLGDYSMAYHHGYWRLRYGPTGAWVDLETGKIVDPFRDPNKWVSDHVLLKISLESLDAEGLVKKLRVAGKESTWKGYSTKKQAQWRDEIRKNFGVDEVYTRKEPKKRLIESWD